MQYILGYDISMFINVLVIIDTLVISDVSKLSK